jgi:2-methylcitrate dehydratase
MTLGGEIGYPSALTAGVWGFDVLFRGSRSVPAAYSGYVMENVLFKISFPAEFHAQTAVECALKLHPAVKDKLEEIEKITIETQEAGARIIDKTGPLDNYADRDHCIQYMVAIPLIFGQLTADSYGDDVASDSRIDALRDKMAVRENESFTRDYFDPEKRGIGNAIQVFFADGSSTERVEISYPIGHRRRRADSVLVEKFRNAVAAHFSADRGRKSTPSVHPRMILKLCRFPILSMRGYRKSTSSLTSEHVACWHCGRITGRSLAFRAA